MTHGAVVVNVPEAFHTARDETAAGQTPAREGGRERGKEREGGEREGGGEGRGNDKGQKETRERGITTQLQLAAVASQDPHPVTYDLCEWRESGRTLTRST